MKQASSRNEFSNNGLQATTHKVFAMHTLSLASHLSSIACGSCLNPDVGHKNNWLPHVQWTFQIDNAKKSDDTVTWKTEGQGRTAENKMNSPTRRSTITRHKWREGER